MLRFRFNPPFSITAPKFVIFNDYLKLNTNCMTETLINTITFKTEEVKPVMKVQELVELSNKYKRDLDLKFYTNNFQQVDSLIKYTFENNNYIIPEFIKKEILDNTFFSTYENWNITDLTRKYNISSCDVFCALCNSKPFEAGVLVHDSSKMKHEEMKKEFINRANENKDYVFFDYWNGVGLKCHFPINVNNNATPFELNMRRYNDRNNFTGYEKIINLINDNKDKARDDYLKYVPTIKETYGETVVDTENPSIESLFKTDTMNKKINEYVEKTCNVSKEELSKQRFYWSHRVECEHSHNKEKLWDYQVTPFYDRYVKSELGMCDIASTFEFNDYGLLRPTLLYKDKIPLERMSMVNMLMFGKTNINFDFLDKLLQFVRFKESNYSFQLDNYIVNKSKYQFSNESRRYDVEWKDDNIHELKFPSNDYEKLQVVKSLIQLMNEVDPKHLNYHNYYQICEWERAFNLSIQMSHISTRNEMERIASKYKMYQELK